MGSLLYGDVSVMLVSMVSFGSDCTKSGLLHALFFLGSTAGLKLTVCRYIFL